MSNNINWVGNRVVDSAKTQNQTGSPARTAGQSRPGSSGSSGSSGVQPAQFSQDEFIAVDPVITQQGPPPSTQEGYIPNYLAANIGKNVRAEFIINTSYLDKTGRLIEVGINYFVLEDVNSRSHIMCDLYSVKFVTVLQI